MTAPELAFLGLDVSSTGVGAAMLNEAGEILQTWVWQSDDPSESERIWSLGKWAGCLNDTVTRRTDGVLALSMEGPFVRGPGSRPLMRAQGAVMSRFRGDWRFYQPQAVKAAAARSGVEIPLELTGKDRMVYAARKYWHVSVGAVAVEDSLVLDKTKAMGDLADALWVAEADRLAVTQAREQENR